MDVEFDRQFPEFDRLLFNEWLAGAQSVPEILAPPLCAEPKPATRTTVDVVVDEDVLQALESIVEEQSAQAPPQDVRKEPATKKSRKRGNRPKKAGRKNRDPKREPSVKFTGSPDEEKISKL